MGDGFKEGEAFLNVAAGEGLQAAGGESFAGEGGDDGALDDGLADVLEGEGRFPGRGEMPGERTQKAVARAGGIGHIGEREGRAAKKIR